MREAECCEPEVITGPLREAVFVSAHPHGRLGWLCPARGSTSDPHGRQFLPI